MTANVGSTDRIIRIIAGLVLLSLLFFLEGPARWFGLIGIVPIVTAFLRWCPAYRVLGVNTCETPKRPA
jgi:hypothetical protein